MQLVLQGAAAGGGNLTFSCSKISPNCSSLEFQLLLNATAQEGRFNAHIVAAKQRQTFPLPSRIGVVVPLLLSMQSRHMNVSADENAFAINVHLSQPAPASGVAVRLQLVNDASAVRVSLLEFLHRCCRVSDTAGLLQPCSCVSGS